MSALAYNVVTARDAAAPPTRYCLFLHGILGTRANWRGLARQFVTHDPTWGAVLVDLREHGDSLGFSPPHSVQSAAADLAGIDVPGPITGVLGHSFGGKVAMQYALQRQEDGDPLEVLYVVDSSPSELEKAGDGGMVDEPPLSDEADKLGPLADPNAQTRASYTQVIIDLLRGLEFPMPDRETFVDAIVAAGHPRGIAMWLAMNLRKDAQGRRTFSLDLDAIASLLDSYFATDSWDALEAPPPGGRVEVIIGADSHVYDEGARERAMDAAELNVGVRVHIIEDAGHWVHVDKPGALVEVLKMR